MDSRTGFSAPEPQDVWHALAVVRDRPEPHNPSGVGCVISLLAIIALVLIPVISSTPVLSSGPLLAVVVGLAVVAVIGALLNVFGGGFVGGAIATDVEEALTQLEAFPAGDPAVLCEAAVRILDGSTVSTGPTTVGTFDIPEVRGRLGDALPFVISVERILLQRNEIYPCFTLDGG